MINTLTKLLNLNSEQIGVEIDANSVHVVYMGKSDADQPIVNYICEKIENSKEGANDLNIQAALKKALIKLGLNNAQIVAVIADQKLIVDNLILPSMPPQELPQAIKLQVAGSAQFKIENPVMDYIILDRKLDKGVEKLNVLMAAIAKASLDVIVNRFKKPLIKKEVTLKKLLFLEDFGDFNLNSFVPPSLAIGQIIQRMQSNENVAVLYMGSTFSEISIYKNSKLEFVRKINVINAEFTKALMSAIFTDSGKIELNMAEAQTLRSEYGIPQPSDNFIIRGKITANQAIALLRPKLEQLSKEITRCLDYYYDKSEIKKLDKIILFGESALFKRLDELLSAELGVKVIKGHDIEQIGKIFPIQTLQNPEEFHRMILAAGAGLSQSTEGINLLPTKFRNLNRLFIQRLIIGLTAISIFLLTVLVFTSLQLQLNFSKSSLEKLKNAYNALLPQARTLKDQLLVDVFVNQRKNYGDLFIQLSYAPKDVFFTELKVEDLNVSLKGVFKTKGIMVKKTLEELVNDLAQGGLFEVKLGEINRSQSDKESYEFNITAKILNR